jgi:excisionase family DNA binding protein
MKTAHSDLSSQFEPLLDVDQAAQLLRVHPKTLQKWAREQRIPAVRYGKRWLFRASELDSWVQSQVHSSGHVCHQSEEIR